MSGEAADGSAGAAQIAQTGGRTLRIDGIHWSRHQLSMRFSVGDLQFNTSCWYPTIDLEALDRRLGRDFMERVHLHTALFEANKLVSLRPDRLDLGPYTRHHTAALERLWQTVLNKVWGQWRYEHDLPGEPRVRWVSAPSPSGGPIFCDRGEDGTGAIPEALVFCGGGKDSLVMMRLMERAGLPFSVYTYTSNVYGPAAPQERLLDGLLARLSGHPAPHLHHRTRVLDDLVDAPVLELHGREYGVRSLTAAETPASVFGALPVVLAGGFRRMVLGHEASANRGNLWWARGGEEINHQWGKSLEAERLLADYLKEELIADLELFSLLMPLHDVLIFELLRQDIAALPATHSCNVQKPWCRRCAKCSYVWLSCRAHLPDPDVRAVFPEELTEIPENRIHFEQLLGLAAHTPFECVGQVEEARLALALCGRRGLLGAEGRRLLDRIGPLDTAGLEPFLTLQPARLPPDFDAALRPALAAAAASARARIIT